MGEILKIKELMFRIQKLLLLEFEEIYEPVIVENPFTQVTVNGIGVKQYHIGLTATKIIFGCDEFAANCFHDVECHNEDPEIETLQLVSLLPLQFLKLQFYRKSKRDIMHLTICGDEERPLYFEFGGHLYKNLYWNTWRERVSTIRLMQPLFFHISGASPFSSTDILPEEEECEAVIHSVPKSAVSICMTYNSAGNY